MTTTPTMRTRRLSQRPNWTHLGVYGLAAFCGLLAAWAYLASRVPAPLNAVPATATMHQRQKQQQQRSSNVAGGRRQLPANTSPRQGDSKGTATATEPRGNVELEVCGWLVACFGAQAHKGGEKCGEYGRCYALLPLAHA
jgi:hypothetical protein